MSKRFTALLSSLLTIFIISVLLMAQNKPNLLSSLLHVSSLPLTPSQQPPQQTPAPSTKPAVLGVQTKNSGCAAQGKNPDPACTPGAIFPNVTKDDVCVSGYTQTVRDVPTELKQQVYEEYGIASHSPGEYEVDHYISLELGGSNDVSNLWPEPAEPQPGFHQKDEVENFLHDQVCQGKMTLQAAQTQVRTNWLAVYNQLHPYVSQ